ncbi:MULTISPECIES: hypothetical protein [Rhizobiaceae]|uniref:hypothetical protein n=1 Tax=Rhizobiaceae TaxID=82115 RepID=UPI001FCE35FF|nr:MULTISPECIES: hypothetical protein [Rhizobiaceae]
MEGCDIVPISRPEGSVVSALGKKAHPDQDIPTIGAQAVGRTNPQRGASSKEPVQVVIVAVVIAKNERHAVHEVQLLGGCDFIHRQPVDDAINRNRLPQRRKIREEELGHPVLLGRDFPAGTGSSPSRRENRIASPQAKGNVVNVDRVLRTSQR